MFVCGIRTHLDGFDELVAALAPNEIPNARAGCPREGIVIRFDGITLATGASPIGVDTFLPGNVIANERHARSHAA
jgi:hypothetical protein